MKSECFLHLVAGGVELRGSGVGLGPIECHGVSYAYFTKEQHSTPPCELLWGIYQERSPWCVVRKFEGW